MSLRICRHCRKDVNLTTKTCPHCHGKLNPVAFRLGLIFMAAALALAYGALGYSYMAYRNAYEQLYCDQSAVIEGTGESCAVACQQFCTGNGADSGFGLDHISAQCECTCSGCF